MSEISETLARATWADDIILMASAKEELGEMIGELIGRAETHSLSIQRENVEYWSLRRRDNLDIRGMTIAAQDDIHFLGLNLVPEAPTVEDRICSAWRAFHNRRRHLTSRCLPRKT